MKRHSGSVVLAASLAAGLALQACSPLKSQPDLSRFYVLTSPTETLQAASGRAMPDLSLGLGPVTLARYLNRAQIVTRVGPNELTFSEIDRWAEPLLDNIVRTLSDNLSVALKPNRVVVYPWISALAPDYAIEINISRFELGTGGYSELAATWSIRDLASGERLLLRRTAYSEPAPEGSMDASVAALSAALADLGLDIAAALRELSVAAPAPGP